MMKGISEHEGLRIRKSIPGLKTSRLQHEDDDAGDDNVQLLKKNVGNKKRNYDYRRYNQSSTKYLSYIDNVPFARRKKPDSWLICFTEISIVCGVLLLGYSVYQYSDRMYIPITKFYANLGIKEAQNRLSQHLLYAANSKEEYKEAMYWLKISALENKNPIAAYNYVIAHIKNHMEDNYLTVNELKDLLMHAWKNGVVEAESLLQHCETEENRRKWKNIVLENESDDEYTDI
ncbi:unnamed protein product [Trichobilharzia regenti]|uniref:Uncharacterized protein n=1 Tax=Trichobilharzia regenti TaxID=157069 RepID=A0A183VPL2_TRIRE|nr:unnamed protein product [Trichobilharzia regenti]VDP98297.1 unnamed protein product [Trichobilharzia regenti]